MWREDPNWQEMSPEEEAADAATRVGRNPTPRPKSPEMVECPTCAGKKTVGGSFCPLCYGDGKVTKEEADDLHELLRR